MNNTKETPCPLQQNLPAAALLAPLPLQRFKKRKERHLRRPPIFNSAQKLQFTKKFFRTSLNINNRESFRQFPAAAALPFEKVIDDVRRPFGILIRVLGHCFPAKAHGYVLKD